MAPPARLAGQNALSVPFESGHLLGTRVRQDLRDGLVALLHDFSSNGSTYVVPWAMVPRAVVMTWFDGALHSRLAQLTRLSPSAIQEAAYDVVAEGGAGEAARRDEQTRRDREEDRRTALLEILSARALCEIGISVDALTEGNITREQLETACAQLGLRTHDLAGTLEAFTRMLMPVGASGVLDGTLEGPLRLTLRQLRQLSTHLACREKHANRDDRDRYALAHRVSEAAVDLAERILARLDGQIAHVAASLAGWAKLEPEMARWIFQLELILDGWPQVIAFHAGTIDPPAGTQSSHASILATILPGLAKELVGLG